MYLNNIIEAEDLISLSFVDPSQFDFLTQDIIRHILKTKSFSAYEIGRDLSIEHAKRYLDLCDGKQLQEMKDSLNRHIIKIVNME